MTRPHCLHWPSWNRRCLAVSVVAVALMLAACTGPGSDTFEPPPTAEVTPTLPVKYCIDQALFELVVEELSPDEFLERVHEDDVDDARAIVYPDDHPRAGEYVALQEWGEDQQRAWGVFITFPGELEDLMPILHERLAQELTPDEFLARLTEGERETVRGLIYPAEHPQAGEFISATNPEVFWGWYDYLNIRPAGEGCPW
jgi:hypothetical protein